jgi:hypothetical protein
MNRANPDPILPLAARRRALLEEARSIEKLYSTMHPTEAAEAETDAKLRDLYREAAAIEKQMAVLTATSPAGLIEQMEALKGHVASDAPEQECLVDAVLRGLRRIQAHSSSELAERYQRSSIIPRELDSRCPIRSHAPKSRQRSEPSFEFAS